MPKQMLFSLAKNKCYLVLQRTWMDSVTFSREKSCSFWRIEVGHSTYEN